MAQYKIRLEFRRAVREPSHGRNAYRNEWTFFDFFFGHNHPIKTGRRARALADAHAEAWKHEATEVLICRLTANGDGVCNRFKTSETKFNDTFNFPTPDGATYSGGN